MSVVDVVWAPYSSTGSYHYIIYNILKSSLLLL